MTPAQSTESGLRSLLKRLLGGSGESEGATGEDSDAEPLNCCRDRAKVVVSGRITSLRLSKGSGSVWLEADLNDGTGVVTLVWMGRRAIAGVAEGRRIKVSGRLTRRGDSLVVYNPDYRLLS